MYAYRYFVLILLAGQALALLWTGTGVFVTLLDHHTRKDISTTLAAGVYFALSATFGLYMAFQRNFVAKLKTNWWKFLILGAVDVQGVHLQNLALKDTTITSALVKKLFILFRCSYTYVTSYRSSITCYIMLLKLPYLIMRWLL